MSIENCSVPLDALFSLIEEIKLGYQEPNKVVGRGRKLTFSHLSFLLLAVVAVVTKTFSDSELHRLLTKDAALLAVLEFSRVPHRTRILRRLKRLVPIAEQQISLFGKTILTETAKDENHSSVSATDGRAVSSKGSEMAQKRPAKRFHSGWVKKCRCRIKLVKVGLSWLSFKVIGFSCKL